MIHTLADVPGKIRRVLRKIDFVAKVHLAENGKEYNTYDEPVVAEVYAANVATSEIDGWQPTPEPAETREDLWLSDDVADRIRHAPVLDLDFPCTLIESTTPGHFHLYLDREVKWGKLKAVLEAMGDAGLLEEGYVKASLERGYTSVRLPWVKKLSVDDSSAGRGEVSENNSDPYPVPAPAPEPVPSDFDWEQPQFSAPPIPPYDHLDL